MSDDIISYSARVNHMPQFPPGPPPANPGPRSRKYGGQNYTPQSARPQPPPPKTDKTGFINPRFKFHVGNQRNKPKRLSPIITNGPISPREAIIKYGEFLTEYEKEEIYAFPDIYYVGNLDKKIEPDPSDEFNQGFDNDTHNYCLTVGDHLAYRFEIVANFGAGAFGQVIRCFDHKTKNPVAVKVIVNTDQMHAQGQIEAQILSKLNSREQHHIVRAYDFFVFRSHICITFEVLGMNLYDFSELNNFKPFPTRLVRLYALQIFSALERIHRIGAVHCDIKPENILLVQGSKTLIKIIDFGSGCFDGYQLYEYIQSRFYRAPEVMLGLPYGAPMDVWSTALVIVELLIGRPLWPGDDELEQLWMISEVLGAPPVDLVNQGKRKDEFFEENGELKQDKIKRTPNSMTLQSILQTNDTSLVDFLMKCLTWDTNDRITAKQALNHPWIRTKEVKVQQQPKQQSILPGLDMPPRK
ncbi:CMGC family protein kinase [Tritrichomonas foetus]|uniref:dual-specificity kinase n=1 Tax=Tritrichomonas foetus TaxID=1144522 RepID=A0A1J4KII7_9EUKA|nr:CMGC family protein kinase [Tritrichomonas foetus]|eukprot:OHT10752.1 CMGC family protein kinase [Tritrichomonas foetus]